MLLRSARVGQLRGCAGGPALEKAIGTSDDHNAAELRTMHNVQHLVSSLKAGFGRLLRYAA